jgi:hypothetical protein
MLALNIQTLFYKIGATNTEYKQKMTESKGKLQEFEQKTKDNIRTLRNWSLAAGAAAAGVVAGLNTLVKSTEQYAGYLEKLSIQTGVAVENMAALGYAAKQNESSLEELGSSMVRLTRRTQEASQGNQAYIKSYERMGVSFRDINGNIKSTDELLLSLADAFAESTDENLKTQVAFNLLGDSGYNLIPLLNQGRQGIVAFAEEANRLGIVLSRENIAKFGHYGEVMDKWKAGMDGVKMQLATAVVPVFTLLGEKANEGLESLMAWVRENPKLVAQGVVLGGVLTTLGLALGAVALGMTIVSKGAVLVRGMFGLLTNPILWLIALGLLLYTAWDENWGGIQEKTQVAVDYVLVQLNKLLRWLGWEELPARFKKLWADLNEVWSNEQLTFSQKVGKSTELVVDFVFGEGTTHNIKQYWTDLAGIWLDTEKPVIQKFSETFTLTMKFILGPETVASIKNYWDTLKKIWGDSETSFLEKLKLTWDATKIFLGFGLKPEGETYEALKEGAETGEWTKFWKIVSDVWSGIAVLLLTLQLTSGAVKGIMIAIGAFFGNTSGNLGIGGIPLAIGIITLGIQLKEALEGGGFESFVKNVLVATLTGAIGGAVFGPGGALLGFNLALSFKLGDVVSDAVEEGRDALGERMGIPREHWGYLEEYGAYRQKLIDEATEGMNVFQKLWWQATGGRPEGMLEWDEWLDWRLGIDDIIDGVETLLEALDDLSAESVHLFPDMTEANVQKAIELLTAITGAEVDPELIMLLARLESGAKWGEGVTHIVHPESGAMGPLQSMPVSRRDVLNRGGLGSEENLYSWVDGMSLEDNWVAQTEMGIRYIQLLLDKESDKIMRVAEELGISFAEALFLSYQEGVNALNTAALSGELDEDFSMLATGHRRTIEEQLTTYHNFTEGGEAIIDAWADGMLNKKPRVEASAEELAQTVADFLIGQSPPPKGPLKYIDIGMQKTMEAGMEGARKGLMDGIPTLELTAREVGESAKEGLFEGLAAGKQVALTPYGVELADEISDEDSPLYMRVLANVKKLLSALGDSTMGWLKGQFPELMAEFDGLFEEAELDFERLTKLIEGIGGETDKVKETTKQWTDSLVSGLSNAIGYGRGLKETFDGVLNVFDNFLGMLASQFLQTQVFAPLFDKIGFGDFLAGLPIFHDGGLVLSPAAYYHSGGYIGELRSDEVPIIAQTGERVLSRQQNDQFESLLQNVSTDGAGAQHIEVNINAVDAASFQELLMRNSDGVKHLIIDDVGRNGPLRKILLQLARS